MSQNCGKNYELFPQGKQESATVMDICPRTLDKQLMRLCRMLAPMEWSIQDADKGNYMIDWGVC